MGLDDASYTEIRERDVTAIGKHCDMQYCHMLDFLPFKCESCGGTFCLDHRSETAHKCPHEGKWAAERLRRELGQAGGSSSSSTKSASTSTGTTLSSTASTCAHPKCKTTINTARSAGVFCQNCRRTYCLTHRLQDSHDCSTLKPFHPPGSVAARAQEQSVAAGEKAKAAFARFKAWTAAKGSQISGEKGREKGREKKGAGSSVVEVMRLKREAKGDAKIPMEKRVYVYVEAEKESTTSKMPKGEFYYSKDWSVGKVLDQAAQALQVQNINNQNDNEETRLRIFHVEGGRMLSFGEKFGDAVATGNTVVLLRGVMQENLIEP